MNWQGDITMHGHTTCASKTCGQVIMQGLALVKTVHVGHSTTQEHFCGEDCYQAWHLTRLNTLGM